MGKQVEINQAMYVQRNVREAIVATGKH